MSIQAFRLVVAADPCFELAGGLPQDSLGLLPPASKKLIDAFLASRKLPDPMTTEFANAVQEALSGLEKIAVKGDEIKQALLQGGSPATPDDLRKRFDNFMNERCKGKDSTKLRFVIAVSYTHLTLPTSDLV